MKAQEHTQKCIRSIRVARELMTRGFPAIDTDADERGYVRWYFNDSQEFQRNLSEIMARNRATRQHSNSRDNVKSGRNDIS